MSQRIRRCSFCRNQGHNISSCDDIRLLEFERLCIEYYAECANISQFENWLIDYYIRFPYLVKSYAVRYCGTTMRNYGMIHTSAISIRIQYLPARSRAAVTTTPELTEELFQLYNNDFNQQTSMTYQEIVQHFLNLLQIMQSNRRRNNKFQIQTTIITKNNSIPSISECNICYESCDTDHFIKLNCSHEFCKNCVKQVLQNERRRSPCCAFCRTPMSSFEMKSQEIRDEFNDLIM